MTDSTTQPSASTTAPEAIAEIKTLAIKLLDDYDFQCEAGSLDKCRDWQRMVKLMQLVFTAGEETAAQLDLAIRQRDEAQELRRVESVRNAEDFVDLQVELNTARTEAVNETVAEIVEWLDTYRGRTAFQEFCSAIPDRALAINLSAMFKREMRNLAEAINRRDFHKKTGEAGE